MKNFARYGRPPIDRVRELSERLGVDRDTAAQLAAGFKTLLSKPPTKHVYRRWYRYSSSRIMEPDGAFELMWALDAVKEWRSNPRVPAKFEDGALECLRACLRDEKAAKYVA